MAVVNGLKTQRYYTGNGTQTVFNFAMDYLRPNFMYLRVDGVQKTYGVDYLVTGQEMQIFVAPPDLATVFIYRSTSTDPLVSWADASVLRASDMTLQEMQLLQGQEEISDIVSNDIADLTLRAESARDRAIIAETNSELSADTAKVSEDNAKASELSATASAGSALFSKDASKVSEDNAKISELNAKVSETNSKTSEDNALASAVNALSSKDASKVSEDNAKASEIACADYQAQIVDLGAYTKAESEARYAPVGTPDNIVNGLKVIPSSGLQVAVEQGRAIISEQVVRYDVFTNTIVLSPRMASLIYAKLDKTIGKVDAKLPDVDANTIVRYDFTNWDGVSAIPNSAVGVNGNTIAVANALTKTGTVNRVDGHCGFAGQGDGSTGYFVSANYTGFPIGATERQLDVLITAKAVSINQRLVLYGTTSAFVILSINASNNISVYANATDYDTSFNVKTGDVLEISFTYDGTTLRIYVNGSLIYSVVIALATGSGIMYVFRNIDATLYGYSTIHYIELRNKVRTVAQIAQLSNDLLLPCSYQTPNKIPFTTSMLSQSGLVSYTSANLIDGSVATVGFNWDSSPIGSYLRIDLGTQQKIEKVSIYGGVTPILKLQGSNDLSNWYDISNPQAGTATVTWYDFLVDSSKLPYRYIQLINTSLVASTNNCMEIQVFSEVSETPTDIRSILPADSIALGYVKTNSTAVIEIDSNSYKYGIRQGATGGNRRVALGWKYFSGATALKWDNPFGTRQLRKTYAWARDTNGTNECDIETYDSATGVQTGGTGAQTASNRIGVFVSAGGACIFNNAWQTTGYIQCYAEVIE